MTSKFFMVSDNGFHRKPFISQDIEHMIDKVVSYRTPLTMLLIAAALLVMGLFLGYKICGMWFSRFGSLVVLFAVASEYKLGNLAMIDISEKIANDMTHWTEEAQSYEPGILHRRWSVMAHLTVITGTVIWGFGDLLFERC